jgi:hypothetical protein
MDSSFFYDPLLVALSSTDAVTLLGAVTADCVIAKTVVPYRMFFVIEQRDIPLKCDELNGLADSHEE